MNKLGTHYGGWIIPQDIQLDTNSIIYSGGVGEDISFDLLLSDKYKSQIVLIDPTHKAKRHFIEAKLFFQDKEKNKFKGNIQSDYYSTIQSLDVSFDSFTYVSVGLWNKETTLKFYKQSNKDYVSQSIIDGMFTQDYDTIQTKTIQQIMNENNHTHIDLLKLDIEGAEINVLHNMLDTGIYPTYLCIEFDLFLQRKDTDNQTKKLIDRLLQTYRILYNDNMNITFQLR
jgi:FkbM family methyltransferase